MNRDVMSSKWTIPVLLCVPVLGMAAFGLTPVRADLAQVQARMIERNVDTKPAKTLRPEQPQTHRDTRTARHHAQSFPQNI